MAGIIHTVLRQYRDTSGVNIQISEAITSDRENNVDKAIVTGANTLVYWTIDRTKLKTLCLYSDVAATVYTNNPSGSSPQDTIALTAGQALVWSLASDGLARCPFSGSVTAIYVTNASDANFKLRALTSN